MANNVELTIAPITAANVVANGALIIVCGDKSSGKTCVVENALYNCLDSFATDNFPPMYIGKDTRRATQYFGKLFESYHSLRNGENSNTLAQAQIWQYGYQNECEQAEFRKQGERYMQEQQRRFLQVEEMQRRPRLLFYFDSCDNFPFVEACLDKTDNHRKRRVISVVETRSMLDFGKLMPDTVIFTSLLDESKHVAFLQRLLRTKKSVARDLVNTANTFIEPRRVALLVNFHQWFASNQTRGFHIYHYGLIPPLYEQLAMLTGRHSLIENGTNNSKKSGIGDNDNLVTQKLSHNKKKHSPKSVGSGSSTTSGYSKLHRKDDDNSSSNSGSSAHVDFFAERCNHHRRHSGSTHTRRRRHRKK